MKAYITKFALTKGIQVVEGKQDGVCFRSSDGFYCSWEWHKNMDKALRRAKAVRNKKLASLKRQIARLEALDFNIMPIAGE